MARYRDAKCKLCRREGDKLFLKGDRCFSNKCAIEKRNYPPGQHGRGRRSRGKVSKYNIQLREKQKLRRTYGLLEKQFHNYFIKAAQQKGITGTALLQLLERRLDSVVYRLGFTTSRAAARQLIRHSHFEVNGRRVNIPSYVVSPGDVIGPRTKSRELFIIQQAIKNVDARQSVSYLDIDTGKLEGRFLEIPNRDAIPVPVNEQLIVELYSK
jgi:small subunit ribosomal protein S4